MLLAVAIIICGLFSWLAWCWPENALALLLAIIPAYVLRFSVLGLPTNIFEISVVAVFIIALVNKKQRHNLIGALWRIPKPFLASAVLFLVAAVISTLVSDELCVSLGILKSWFVIPLLLAWLLYSSTASTFRRLFIKSLIWSGVIMSLIGLSQAGSVARIYGIYDVPNSLALWLAPLFVLTLWLGLCGNHKFYLLLSIPLIATLLLTQSAMALVAILTSLLLGIILFKTGNTWRILAVIGLVACIGAFVLGISGRLTYLVQPFIGNSGQTNSITVREQLWSVSIDLIKEHPVLGVGLGQFEPAYQEKLHERFARYNTQCGLLSADKNKNSICKYPPQPEFVYRDPHNWLLSFWLNLGILGLLSFIYLHVYVFYCVFRSSSIKNKTTQALMLAVVALLVFGFADTIYWKNDLATLQWTLFALLLFETSPTSVTCVPSKFSLSRANKLIAESIED